MCKVDAYVLCVSWADYFIVNCVFLSQNVEIGFWVTRVGASDGDDGINGQVEYEILTPVTNPNKDWLKFKIEKETGVIRTDAMLDREMQQTYYVS